MATIPRDESVAHLFGRYRKRDPVEGMLDEMERARQARRMEDSAPMRSGFGYASGYARANHERNEMNRIWGRWVTGTFREDE